MTQDVRIDSRGQPMYGRLKPAFVQVRIDVVEYDRPPGWIGHGWRVAAAS